MRSASTKANIASAIARAQAERAERTEITADRVVRELAAVAFASLCDYAEWDAKGITVKNSCQLSRAQTAAVVEVMSTTRPDGTATTRIKLHDKLTALHDLGLHTGVIEGARVPAMACRAD